MKVHVHTFANLRDYAPTGKGSFELTLAERATVADVFAALRVLARATWVVRIT